MPEVRVHHFLPALMGSLHQQRAEGELVLEQNDGTRRLFWADGDLKYLRSDVMGEQFGSFLIRRGVLDMAALKELLTDGEGSRVGDRMVQWGLMTQEERDERLQELLGSVLLHAMEHPILRVIWNPGLLDESLSGDLQFRFDHRWLVWDTFRSAKIDRELVEMFHSEPDWRWEARVDLLDTLSDLPLTPTLAYALSLLGTEPLGCATIGSLTGLSETETARLVATLWALGGLTLVRGDLPLSLRPEPQAVPMTESPSGPEVDLDVEIEGESGPEPILLLQDDLIPPLALTPDTAGMRVDSVDLDTSEPTPSSLPPVPPDEEDLPTPERARHLLVKAKSYMMQNRTSEAIRALEQSLKLDGDSPSAYEPWMLLGRLRLSNPAWSTRAIEALQTASRLNPRVAEPWALMGELYHRKGFKANAQGCFRRALELDPSVPVPPGFLDDEASSASHRERPGKLMGKLRAMLGRDKD